MCMILFVIEMELPCVSVPMKEIQTQLFYVCE